MPSLVRDLLALLDRSERRPLARLLALMLLVALIETVGVGSILPFLAVLADPTLVARQPQLAALHAALGNPDPARFTVLLGALALAVFLIANLLQAALVWRLQSFTWQVGHGLTMRLLAGYLAEPPLTFGRRHSAERLQVLFTETLRLVGNILVPTLTVVARGVAAVAIFALLTVIEPRVALAAGGLFLAAYVGMFLLLRRRVRAWSEHAMAARTAAHRGAGEAIAGHRTLILHGAEGAALARVETESRAVAFFEARAQIAAQVPRMVVEAVIVGTAFVLVLVAVAMGAGAGVILPVAGAYAFAASRLLPALQQVYAALTLLRAHRPVLSLLRAELEAAPPAPPRPPALPWDGPGAIVLEGIGLTYPGSVQPVLDGVDLVIAPGERLALTGATGAGKSTLIDIVAGLVPPDRGMVRLDGQPLRGETARRWHAVIGYLPQHVFVADGTIGDNIAFGVEAAAIDPGRMAEVARLARLDDLMGDAGLDRRVGEGGRALSGGQRQRLGLARVLYRRPRLLILDEPTSALDEDTERAIVAGLATLAGTTMLIVTHRPALLDLATRMLHLERGRLTERVLPRRSPLPDPHAATTAAATPRPAVHAPSP